MRGQRGVFGHRAGIAAAMAAEHDAGFLERVALDWGLLKHGWGSRRQNSMPFWAFTPAWKGCLISVISVTRSAASISSGRSEEHTSELQSLMRISYAVFCLKKKLK